ncbi:hypothetical protein AJ78_08787, partial [Emergomyces pasteurianus Ep9510]
MTHGKDETPDWFRSVISDELAFMESVQPLLDYSLAECQENAAGYHVHPVIHEWCHSQLKENDEMKIFAMFILGCAAALQETEEPWALVHRLLPHCDQ